MPLLLLLLHRPLFLLYLLLCFLYLTDCICHIKLSIMPSLYNVHTHLLLPPPRRLCKHMCLLVCLLVYLSAGLCEKLLNQFAPNLVEGWKMGHGRTHSILWQFWIIYDEFEFFPLKSGICSLTVEVCALLSAFCSLYSTQHTNYWFCPYCRLWKI